MKTNYYQIYSLNAKDMANFYANLFCCNKPELIESDGSFFYRCKLPFGYLLDIFYAKLDHDVKELKFEVYSTYQISRKLTNQNIDFEYIENSKSSFSFHDLDGNKIYVESRLKGVGMPILG